MPRDLAVVQLQCVLLRSHWQEKWWPCISSGAGAGKQSCRPWDFEVDSIIGLIIWCFSWLVYCWWVFLLVFQGLNCSVSQCHCSIIKTPCNCIIKTLSGCWYSTFCLHYSSSAFQGKHLQMEGLGYSMQTGAFLVARSPSCYTLLWKRRRKAGLSLHQSLFNLIVLRVRIAHLPKSKLLVGRHCNSCWQEGVKFLVIPNAFVKQNFMTWLSFFLFFLSFFSQVITLCHILTGRMHLCLRTLHYRILTCSTSPVAYQTHQGCGPPSVFSLCQIMKCGNNSNPFFWLCCTSENMINSIQLKVITSTRLSLYL